MILLVTFDRNIKFSRAAKENFDQGGKIPSRWGVEQEKLQQFLQIIVEVLLVDSEIVSNSKSIYGNTIEPLSFVDGKVEGEKFIPERIIVGNGFFS